MVVVGLTDGIANVYSSNLFIAKPFDMAELKAWTQPMFIGAMVIVGVWQFYRARANKSSRGEMPPGAESLLRDLPPHLRSQVL